MMRRHLAMALMLALSPLAARAEPPVPPAAIPGKSALAPPAPAVFDEKAIAGLVGQDPATGRARALSFLDPARPVSARDRSRAAHFVSLSLYVQDDLLQALRYAELAHDLARKSGDKALMARARADVGTVQLSLGRVEDAIRSYARARDEARAINESWVMVAVMGNLGGLLTETGNPREGEALLREAERLSRNRPPAPPPWQVAFSLGNAHLQLGRPEDTLRDIARAEALLGHLDESQTIQFRSARAAALLALGKTAEARDLATACLKDAIRIGLAYPAFDCNDTHASAAYAARDAAAMRADLAMMRKASADAAKTDLPDSLRQHLAIAMREEELARLEGNTATAAAAARTALEYREKLNQLAARSSLALAAATFVDEGRDMNIALLEARNANLALEARAHQLRGNAALAGTALLGTVALAAIRANRISRKLNAALARLHEQTTLRARDVQHRARNNLQILTSLLNAQGRRRQRGETTALIEELRTRIDAMSRVHAALYQADPADDLVEAPGFIERLAAGTCAAYAGTEQPALRLAIAPLVMPRDMAVALGLLLSELIVNALKHARARTLTLTLERAPAARQWALVVQDDGVGMAAGPPGEGGEGLGLVRDLAAQLRGTAELAPTERGTCWWVRFAAPGA